MSRIFTITIFIVLFCHIKPTKLVSQEWNTARITVMYGSSVPFNFNTLSKIKNGIEINEGTFLGISMADSAKVGHTLQGFKLFCRAFNGVQNIKGEGSTLDLSLLKIKAENLNGLGSGGTSAGYIPLSSGWTELFTYTKIPWENLTWANNQLRISYSIGSLLGKTADYYNVEVEFELVPTGIGF